MSSQALISSPPTAVFEKKGCCSLASIGFHSAITGFLVAIIGFHSVIAGFPVAIVGFHSAIAGFLVANLSFHSFCKLQEA